MKPNVLIFVRKVGIKAAVAAVFSAVWCLLVTEGVSPNAPLSLFAALYLAGAWLSYLKKDGLAIFRLRRPVASTADHVDAYTRGGAADPLIGETDEPDEDDAADEATIFRIGITSSVVTAALLIAVSFLFPM